MKERAEQMFWIHTRGVVVALPPDATASIGRAHANGEEFPKQEQRRLSIIVNDPILKKRYPSPEAGRKYMHCVNMEWREALYAKANLISGQIAEQAKEMGKEDFAILLFGSVAKCLARKEDYDDDGPSNIDLAVIGDFTNEDREELFNRIRPFRDKGREEIGNNVGVFIQTPDKLRNSNYGVAFMYIGSSARALYDPKGVWSSLQEEALLSQRRCKEKKQNGGSKNGITKWIGPKKTDVVFRPEAVVVRQDLP